MRPAQNTAFLVDGKMCVVSCFVLRYVKKWPCKLLLSNIYYQHDNWIVYYPIRPLRSSGAEPLTIPRIRSKCGCFQFLWFCSLEQAARSSDLRSITTVSTFKDKLQTFNSHRVTLHDSVYVYFICNLLSWYWYCVIAQLLWKNACLF